MDSERFWSIIQGCHEASGGDMDRKDQLIKAAISRLSCKEAEAFYVIFNQMMDAAYTWGLWGAAYVINGGCGDDAFADFRASLISRGRAAYQEPIADSDSLADEDIDFDAWFHEGFQYGVTEGVKAALGTRPRRATPPPAIPAGKQWTEATVRDNFPKLANRLMLH
jgi:uncharacterized protein DUF4240